MAHQKGTMLAEPGVTNAYAGGSSGTAKDAKKRKRGGAVTGGKTAMRLDRPGRQRGGRVGADTAPLTHAADVTQPKSFNEC